MSRQPHQHDRTDLGLRSDIYSMLMPFFPEEPGRREYNASINGYSIRITADDPDTPIATPHDRKILNLLAGAIARNIRLGEAPTRHVVIDTRTIIEILTEGSPIGGSQYTLVLDRLKRLMSTVIETEMPLGDGIRRRRRFRWIDAFEHDDKDLPGGKKMLGLRITISEDAFLWMTRSLGFDISATDFRSVTSYRSSIWRIYEICLARLIAHQGRAVFVSIDDLRTRIPIASQLKLFKSRTLKAALQEIPNNDEMSAHIAADLVRRTNAGFEVIDFSKRARLDSLYVKVTRGTGPLPDLNAILPEGRIIDTIETSGGTSMPP